MKQQINRILEADSRLWNQREWFDFTLTLLCEEIAKTFDAETVYREDPQHVRLIDKLQNFITHEKPKSKKLQDILKIVLIFFNTNQYLLAEEYIEKLTQDHQIRNVELQGLLSFLLAEINIEKMDYRKANEHFLHGLGYLYPSLSSFEQMDYFLRWTSLFIESNDLDFAERLLGIISVKVTPHYSYLYTNMLYMFFSLRKRQHQPESTITYANLLSSCNGKHLQNDQWYNLHIFCGDYFSSIDHTFEKTIYHYTHANTFLTNKSKDYIRQISELNLMLSPAEYMEIRAKYEEKLYIIVLENSMHNNHFITSLKTAYLKLQDAHKTLKEHSYLDNLTGLYNRQYLWERSTEFFQRAKNRKVPISCFMIDLDNFKQLNDTFGHLESDRVLKQICHCIKTFFRKTDIVIRFGGDEILALLYNLNSENAKLKGEKLRKAIEDLSFTTQENKKIKATVSIGISSVSSVSVGDDGNRPASAPKFRNETEILNHMIEVADKCLYQAKAEGRNGIRS